MVITTTEAVPGKEIAQILGIAKGNAIRTRHIGSHLAAGLMTIVGGEFKGYVKALDETRAEAEERMIAEAKALNADAIVQVRYATSQVMDGASEILAYGTAVRLK